MIAGFLFFVLSLLVKEETGTFKDWPLLLLSCGKNAKLLKSQLRGECRIPTAS